MKKRIIIGLIIVVVVGAAVWWFVASQKTTVVPTVKATRGNMTEEVLVTGKTKPSQSVELSFERTGKVTGVYAKIGDKVRPGQILVELEKRELNASLAQAQASLASQQARLDELLSGTRPEQIAIQEVRVSNAQVARDDVKNSLLDVISSTYTTADDAARNKTDAMFTDPRTNNPQLNILSTNSQFKNDLETKKINVEKLLTSWKVEIDGLSVADDLPAAAATAVDNLYVIKDFLNELAQALNSAIVTPSVSEVAIASWSADTSLARTSINSAISSLNAATSALQSAESNLKLEENTYALQKAGNTPEQIASQRAVVDQYQASIQSIYVQLDKSILRSPIEGVITKQDAKLGQIVTVSTSGAYNSGLISIISQKKLEIEANIPEVDIGRVIAGLPVRIIFDALPGENFKGTVARVDPAETIIDGVVNYKITVVFEDGDERVKSGLTANLSIETAVKENVVLLPQYAILENDNGTFVRVPDGSSTKDIPVVLGARDQNGMVEIVSGISEGTEVQNIGIKQ